MHPELGEWESKKLNYFYIFKLNFTKVQAGSAKGSTIPLANVQMRRPLSWLSLKLFTIFLCKNNKQTFAFNFLKKCRLDCPVQGLWSSGRRGMPRLVSVASCWPPKGKPRRQVQRPASQFRQSVCWPHATWSRGWRRWQNRQGWRSSRWWSTSQPHPCNEMNLNGHCLHRTDSNCG